MRHVVLIACGSFNPVTNMHLRMFELARDSLNKSGRYKVLGGIASPVSSGYKKVGLVSVEHRLAMLRLALQPAEGSGCPESWVKIGSWESSIADWTPTAQVMRHYQAKIDEMVDAAKKVADTTAANGPESKRFRRQDDETDDLGWLAPLISRIVSTSDHRRDTSDSANNSDQRQQRDGGSCLLDIRPMLLCGADVLASFAIPGLWKEEDMVSLVRDFGIVVLSRPGSDPHKFVHGFDLINPYERNICHVTEWASNDLSSTLIRRTLARNESVRYLLPDSVIDYIYKQKLYDSTAEWPCLENFV